MQTRIVLGLDDHFYLGKTSYLHHSHCPCLESEAISQNDMNMCDIDHLTLLFSANIQPFQISQIMG
jgi:hypothetical protein